MLDQEVLNAFQIMWGAFPEPVLLVHKSRTILAINDAAQAAGVTPGVKCSSYNPENKGDGHCRQCRALEALGTGQATSQPFVKGEKPMKGYWVPLKEVEDVYLHFAISTRE